MSLPLARVGFVVLAFLTAVPSSAAAAPIPDPEVPGTYIVQAAPGALDDLTATLADIGAAPEEVYDDVLDGVAVDLTSSQASKLARSGDATRVVKDTPIATTDIQTPPPSWGLDRIDQANLPLDASYAYDDLAGGGVRVYVVDTGVTPHPSFGTRLVAGHTVVADGRGTKDCEGHGTQVAGLVGSTTYGVAKSATIVPVRVLDCLGEGTATDLIEGLDWIAGHHPAGTPGIVNLSLSGPLNTAVDDAVASLIAQGLTVTVAAGNDNTDACNVSPAAAASAITVGASTEDDQRATFSNWGSCLDLFAPGEYVQTLDAFDTTGAVLASGTSMSSPLVAGVAALYLAQYPTATPAAVRAALVGNARLVVTDSFLNRTSLLVYSSLIPAPAAAPSGLTVEAASLTSLSLRWAAMAGPKPSDYLLAWRAAGSGAWSTETVVGTTATLDGLAPDTDYEVTVAARNLRGSGPTSTALVARTAPTLTPSGPTALTASAAITTVTVAWEPPVEAVSPVTGYTVEQSTDGTTWDVVGTPDAATRTVTLTGLEPFSTVQVRVGAQSAAGTGARATVTARTFATPSAPRFVAARPASTTSLNVTWVAPEQLLGVRGYAVEQSTDGETWSPAATTDAATLVATVTGLDPDTDYQIRVRATTTTAPGEISTPVFAKTDSGVAGAPTGVNAYVSTKNVTVQWSPMDGTVTGYRLERSTDGTAWEPVTDTTGAGSVTIDGLEPDTAYLVRVAALDGAVVGPWTSIATRTAPVPGPLSPITVTTTSTRATFKFGRPAVSSALVTWYQADTGTDGAWDGLNWRWPTWGPGTRDALIPGTAYQMRFAPSANGSMGPWTVVSFTTAAAPTPPVALTATATTNAIRIAWEPPASYTGTLGSYTVQRSDDGGASWSTVSWPGPSQRSAVVTGLQPGATVRLRVAAVVDGVVGAMSTATATTQRLPGAPPVTTSTSNTGVTVRWQPPAVSPDQVTAYLVEVSSSSGWQPVALTGADGRRAVVTGLSPGTSYQVRVTPVSELDLGTPSVVSARTTGSSTPPNTSWMSQLTLSPDLTGDGTGDIVGVDVGGNLKVYTTTSARVGPLAVSGPGWAQMTVYAPGDWNTDGRNDLIARTTTGDLWLYPGNGRAGFGAPSKIGNGWTGYRVVPAGDVNGDGRADLLAIDPKGYLWLYPGAGAGKFGKPIKVGNGWSDFELYAAGDQNLDGKVDILGIDPAGRLWYYAGRGGGYFWQRVQVGNGWNGFEFASGADLTGDGIGDLVGRDAQHRLWLYRGKVAGGFLMRVQIGTGW